MPEVVRWKCLPREVGAVVEARGGRAREANARLLMTKARAGKKGRPAPSPAAGVGAAYEFRADSAAVADLLDLGARDVTRLLGVDKGCFLERVA